MSPADGEDWAEGDAEGGRSCNANESRGTRSSRWSVAGDSATRVAVAPSIEGLDPAVTAAILTQVACGVLDWRETLVASACIIALL